MEIARNTDNSLVTDVDTGQQIETVEDNRGNV